MGSRNSFVNQIFSKKDYLKSPLPPPQKKLPHCCFRIQAILMDVINKNKRGLELLLGPE